jgi:hypothetical protein
LRPRPQDAKRAPGGFVTRDARRWLSPRDRRYNARMPHRVIVWGTGNVGVPALRIVIANPALELAGVVVSNPAKVGKDAGELCGLPPTGCARDERRRGGARVGRGRGRVLRVRDFGRPRRSTTSSAACAPA